MFPFLLLSLFLPVWSVLICPIFSCTSSLPANMCINRINSLSFQINSNGCNVGYECAIPRVTQWIKNSLENSMACLPQTAYNSSSTISVTCPPQELQKDFLSFASFLACKTDSDCKLQDGNHTSCMCVIRGDGLGVCTADISNMEVFSQFWTDCGKSGEMKDMITAEYWSLVRQWWPWMQSNLLCNSIFREMVLIRNAEIIYNRSQLTQIILIFAAFFLS